jgi:hypothetical protein
MRMKTRGSILFLAALIALCGCRERDTATPESVEVASPPARDRLVFSESLRVDDDTVNQFVSDAMHTCVGGAYEPFRLLWSAQYEPVDRAHFEKHWQSIDEIDVLALEKDPEPESRRYALCADVIFDPGRLPPNHELRDNPRRRIVLLIVREENRWRLARASKPVRKWLLTQVAARLGEPAPAEEG